MMRFYNSLGLSVLTGICLFQISHGDSSTWKSGPPDGLPKLNKLSVDCGKEEMTIYLEFTAPYDGSVYSKSNGQSQRCIHVVPHSQITEATFSIDYHSCGTRSDSQGKYYENTIIIQYDDIVIEAWDEAKKIRCEWHDGYEKSAYKMPITISDLDVVEMNFQGDDVDCWLEVQDGKGPWSAKVEGLVPLGSPLTLVVAIQDSEGNFDMRVKSCIAHDGHKHPIHLTDEDGCVLRPKMMSPFQKTSDTKGTASVIAYSHFYAFKFPETVEVTIQCTVEICRHGCPDTCMQGRDAEIGNLGGNDLPAQGKEEIPTYKDTHAFSTVVTSKPGKFNHTAINNTSVSNQSNATKDEPLKASSDTQHDFYVDRFPYELYDLLEAEERQDKDEHELYINDDNDYEENKDHIYFPQLTNVFAGANEQGKNFPSNQKIQNISLDAESTTSNPEITTVIENIVRTVNSKEILPITHSLEISEELENKEHAEKVKHKMDTFESTDSPTKLSITSEPGLTESHYAKISQQDTLNQLFSPELSEQDSTELQKNGKEKAFQELKSQFSHESLHESNPHFLAEILSESNTQQAPEYFHESNTKQAPEYFHESNTQQTAESLHKSNTQIIAESLDEPYTANINTEHTHDNQEYNEEGGGKYKSVEYEYDEKRNLNNEDTFDKKLTDASFEDYRIKARKPLDNNEMWHNIHNFNYRPFMPPAPVPPLTLYNGLPLHYYNHPRTNLEYLGRDGYQYINSKSFQNEYAKSKLRSPGSRRGRREIGEKEQLGLKQTLRVVATTDFDFLMKDNDEIKPLYVGIPDADKDVCIAPSSFAAGLGLLLLANICVLCVVVFLGHHYYVYRNIKGKNIELLSTEMT